MGTFHTKNITLGTLIKTKPGEVLQCLVVQVCCSLNVPTVAVAVAKFASLESLLANMWCSESFFC